MQINPSLFPFVVTFIACVIIWLITFRLTAMDYFKESKYRRYLSQIIRVSTAFIALMAVVLSLPVSDSVRGQMVTLIGVVVSGVFAFASTTVIANLMAGVMLRMNKPFRTGDFIRVERHFGRVIELGLFESEIQSEHSTIIALPNTFLIATPIEVTSPEGAIVSAEVSLGYDVHHDLVEPLLLASAEQVGLTEPFTQILSLGDFSIVYRVSGVLSDVKQLLTTRSNLHRAVLDALHQADIEIVSPSFMNQRPIGDVAPFIPTPLVKRHDNTRTNAEDVVFSKAEEAEKAEKLIERLNTKIAALKAQIKDASGDDKTALQTQLELHQNRLENVINLDKENV